MYVKNIIIKEVKKINNGILFEVTKIENRIKTEKKTKQIIILFFFKCVKKLGTNKIKNNENFCKYPPATFSLPKKLEGRLITT